MRKPILALLLVFGASCGAEPVAMPAPTASPTASPAAAATPTPTPVPTVAPIAFGTDRAMDHVRALAVEIGQREAGTRGDVLAGDFIAARVRALGWRVDRQAFPLPQGGQSSNIIGTPPGFDATKPYLIIGGHRDSLRGPGANDNATGIGIALEIARSVDEDPAAQQVRFVAFGAEEVQPVPGRVHHVGSRHYVDHMSADERRNLTNFVNVDMVGFGDLIYCGRLSTGPREGTERCLRVASEQGIPSRERVTPDWSDHGTFLKEGMNAVFLWTGEDPCCNHTPKDTMDRVRRRDVERSGRLALAIVRSYKR